MVNTDEHERQPQKAQNFVNIAPDKLGYPHNTFLISA